MTQTPSVRIHLTVCGSKCSDVDSSSFFSCRNGCCDYDVVYRPPHRAYREYIIYREKKSAKSRTPQNCLQMIVVCHIWLHRAI